MRTLSTSTATKLFATGFTVGPIVDSLHNQCLLRYDVLPISLQWPTSAASTLTLLSSSTSSSSIITDHNDYPYLFCSSWMVPPLLGIAYVILGGVLPLVVESVLLRIKPQNKENSSTTTTPDIIGTSSSLSLSSPSSHSSSSQQQQQQQQQLKNRAFCAVATTAMIIKLSEYLETHHDILFVDDTTLLSYLNIHTHSESSLLVMIIAAIFQWVLLDRSGISLLIATLTAIGGPLAELPFVGHGVWTYLDEAANYFPLQNINNNDLSFLQLQQLLQVTFGTSNYRDLALSTITGPCYFAVAMDAIALGRWFDSLSTPSSSSPCTMSDQTKP